MRIYLIFILVVAAILFFTMYFYSGINKIINFQKKSKILTTKLSKDKSCNSKNYEKGCDENLKNISKVGMGAVIFLELILSLYVVLFLCLLPYLLSKKVSNKSYNILKWIAVSCVILFVLFMITVTAIYHPPKKGARGLIPFFSNLTDMGGLLFLLFIILIVKKEG